MRLDPPSTPSAPAAWQRLGVGGDAGLRVGVNRTWCGPRPLLPRVGVALVHVSGYRSTEAVPTEFVVQLRSMPTLAVLRLSDSFAALWPTLAAECELDLALLDDASDFGGVHDGVCVIAAGGAEAGLAEALRKTAGNAAAIGALADHRLAFLVARAGAAAYFAFPDDYDLFRAWLRDRADRLRSRSGRNDFVATEQAKYRFDGILGESEALRRALARLSRVIPHANVTVLLTGETGTGKELFARAIHYNGPRREAPFVDVNCAAIPENLLESELFGHEKGAFTDATSTKPGLFAVANGGTLFLDEIGHLPLALQGKVLRALEERTTRRVGGTRAEPFDVRLVAATHVDLAAEVARGRFREDLYYRLNVVPIPLPPLRDRPSDVIPLVRHFLARFATEYGLPTPTLSAEAEHTLLARAWPGNVRELRNATERALLLASGPVLNAADFHADGPLPTRRDGIALPFPATIDEITRAATMAMLALCRGNKSETARRLGVSRMRLSRLMEADGTTEPDDDPQPARR